MIALAMLPVLLLTVPLGWSEPSTLTLWSNPEPIAGEVVGIGEQGVEIRVGEQIIPTIVPWYDVRDLKPITNEYAQFRSVAKIAWRGHARLQRGDYSGALAIYALLGEEYLWKTGPQSADVSLGLARCLLDQNDRVRAVVPLVSWLVATDGVDSSLVQDQETAGYDVKYGVLVDLPPVFGPDDHTTPIDPLPESDHLSDRQRAVYGYFHLAHDSQIHRTESAGVVLEELERMLRGRETRDPGLELFEDMVVSQAHPDAEKRNAARLALERRIRANTDTWIELWARLALGVSMLGDADTETNERGVIELIHIIVRLDQINQPLAVLASQIANEYLVRTQRAQWGNELMHEARSASTARSIDTIPKEQAAHE